MRGIGIKEQAVTGLHVIKLIPMAIADFTLKQINENHAFMFEGGETPRLLGQGQELGLDHNAAGVVINMTKQVIFMTGTGSAAFNCNAFAGFYKHRIARFFITAEEIGQGHAKRTCQGLK